MFSEPDKTSKRLSQPAADRTALKSILIFAVVSTAFCVSGCSVGKFWKKDNDMRLSANHQDSVAPPSRSFDPAPTQFAQAGSASKQNAGGSETANKPTRQPYGSGSSTKPNKQVAANGFGFPSGSDSMLGNNDKKDFSVPDAQDFRRAMQNATQNTTQLANNTTKDATRSAENAFQSTRDLSADTFKRALNPINQVADSASPSGQSLANKAQQTTIDFVGGGDFGTKAATTSNNTGQGFEVAAQSAPAAPAAPASTPSGSWNNDFAMTVSSQRVKNQFVGSDFDASVKQATEQAQQSMKQHNQKQLDRFNTIKSENEYLATQSPTFQTTPETAPNQFQAPNPALASASPSQQFKAGLNVTRAPNFQPTTQPPFSPATQPAPSTNQFASTPKAQFQAAPTTPAPPAPRNDFAQTTNNNDYDSQLTIPRRHVLPSATPDELARKARQLRERLEGGLEPARQTVNNAIQATNDVIGTVERNIPVGYTQGDGPYPTTNFASYAGRERVAQVTPIEPATAGQSQSTQPVLRAQSGSSLPRGILNGNGSYAPGSVKSFSPIQ